MSPTREFGRRRFVPETRSVGGAKPAPARVARNAGAIAPGNGGGEDSGFAVSKLVTAAVIIGAALTVGWSMSAPGPWDRWLTIFGRSHNGLDFSGERIGRAQTAPVLKLCLTTDVFGFGGDLELSPDMMYSVLKESEGAKRVSKVFNGPREHAVIELAQTWGEIADCVYRQNSFRLCDIDNRRLAVESVGIFVRQADGIIEKPETTYAAQPGEIDALRSTRDRVLNGLSHRLRSGVLIASDFPSTYAPAAVRKVLDVTEPAENECAKKP